MTFQDFREQARQLRTTTESRRNELKDSRRQLGGVSRRRQTLTRGVVADERDNHPELIELAQRETALRDKVVNDKTGYTDALLEELRRLNEFLAFTNPIDNIDNLDDDTPILLFPLRLETRFKKVMRDGAELDQLWVRVFPDDIVIDSFENDLSATEIRNIKRYWINRWKSGKDEGGNRAAWRGLASSHGPGRAYWLTQNFRPVNLDAEPDLAAGEIILVNSGNVDAHPLIRLYGPQDAGTLTGFTVQNITTGAQLDVDFTTPMVASDIFTVDMKRIVTVQTEGDPYINLGGANRYGDWNHPRTPFKLQPGTNVLRLEVDGTTTDASCVVTYRHTSL